MRIIPMLLFILIFLNFKPQSQSTAHQDSPVHLRRHALLLPRRQGRKSHSVGRIRRATWLGFDLPLLFGRCVIRRVCGVPLPCGGLRRTETPYLTKY
jgi:hypothetical protein